MFPNTTVTFTWKPLHYVCTSCKNSVPQSGLLELALFFVKEDSQKHVHWQSKDDYQQPQQIIKYISHFFIYGISLSLTDNLAMVFNT